MNESLVYDYKKCWKVSINWVEIGGVSEHSTKRELKSSNMPKWLFIISDFLLDCFSSLMVYVYFSVDKTSDHSVRTILYKSSYLIFWWLPSVNYTDTSSKKKNLISCLRCVCLQIVLITKKMQRCLSSLLPFCRIAAIFWTYSDKKKYTEGCSLH